MTLVTLAVPFTLVSTTVGDSPVFGTDTTASTSGFPLMSWHFRASIPTGWLANWGCLISSIVAVAQGPAQYFGFSDEPDVNHMPRAYSINAGAPAHAFEFVPVTTPDGSSFDNTSWPWIWQQTDLVSNFANTFFMTEFLRGGQPGPNFQWKEPNWLVNIDAGHSIIPNGSSAPDPVAADVYQTGKITTVDYWFGAQGWWFDPGTSPSLGRYLGPATFNFTDARLIILACTSNGQIDSVPGLSGIRRRSPSVGSIGPAKL